MDAICNMLTRLSRSSGSGGSGSGSTEGAKEDFLSAVLSKLI